MSGYLHDAALNGEGQTYATATTFLLDQLDNFTMVGLSTALEQYFPQIPAEDRVPFIYGVTCSAQVVARSFYTWQENHNSYDPGMRRAADRAYSAFAFWNYGLREKPFSSRSIVPAIDSTGSMLERQAPVETAASALNEHVLNRDGPPDQRGVVRSQSDAGACAVTLARSGSGGNVVRRS